MFAKGCALRSSFLALRRVGPEDQPQRSGQPPLLGDPVGEYPGLIIELWLGDEERAEAGARMCGWGELTGKIQHKKTDGRELRLGIAC